MDPTDDKKPSGIIEKISLKNFVNYSRIDFEPTCGLNILVGPNGSGKSSLVSAIVLGLGGKPNVIGRSNDIHDYIMSGKDSAKIELELYNASGRNYVISRKVTRAGSSSSWRVNNKNASVKDVEHLMKKLNIQVDNLCQLLPQDRVQDFAKMDSLQLLENTQKTIGNNDLYSKYVKLKELRVEHKEVNSLVEVKTKSHDYELQTIQRMEKDVQSILERRKVMKSITICKQKLAWLMYRSKKEEMDKANGYYGESVKKLQEVQKEMDPKRNMVKRLERDKSEKQQISRKFERELRQIVDVIRNNIQETNYSQTRINNIKSELEKKLENEAQVRSKVEILENKIQGIVEQMEQHSESELTAVTKEANVDIMTYTKHLADLRVKEEQLRESESSFINNLRALEHHLEKATSMERRKLQVLSTERDVYSAYLWLQSNKDKFSCTVYGPLFMEISVNDVNNAKYIEFVVPKRDLIAFIAESAEGTTEVLKQMREDKRWQINAAYAKPELDISQTYPPKINLFTIKRYGFDCYLIDLVEGPSTVLGYLCKYFNLHNIPVAFQKINTEVIPKNIRAFFIGDLFYRVSISKYSGLVSTSIKSVMPPTYLAVTVDKALINELNRQINLKKKLVESNRLQVEEVAKQRQEIEVSLNLIKSRKKDASAKLEQLRAMNVRLSRFKDEKNSLINFHTDKEKEKADAETRIQEVVAEAIAIERRIVMHLKEYNEMHVKMGLADMEHEHLTLKKEALGSELLDMEDSISQYKERCNELKNAVNELQLEVNDLVTKGLQLTEGLHYNQPLFKERFGKAFSKLPDSVEEIKAKIYNSEARAKCLHNPHDEKMLNEYEKSRETCKDLETELRSLRKRLDRLVEELSELKGSWLAEIEDVVAKINTKFSQFFSAMSCVGEVRLNKGEDEDSVEKYGLEILVKFRDDHGLHVLDGFTQSGGERALTTAVFLLSLQNLSVAPFRCVDEINQGMDKFNERRVYNLLFSTVTQNSSQYFLITPKLLDHVEYPDHCCVHNILNSHYIFKEDEEE